MKDLLSFNDVVLERDSEIYVAVAVNNKINEKYPLHFKDIARFDGKSQICTIDQSNGNKLVYEGQNHEEMYKKIGVLMNQAEVKSYSIHSPESIYNKR